MELRDFYGNPNDNTFYSWRSRGWFGEPDITLSGTDMWYRDRFRDPANPRDVDHGPRPALPVLLGRAEVAEAFEVKAYPTVDSWRRRYRDKAVGLPEPVMTVSRTDIYTPEQWIPFAAATGRPYNPPATNKSRAAELRAQLEEAREFVASFDAFHLRQRDRVEKAARQAAGGTDRDVFTAAARAYLDGVADDREEVARLLAADVPGLRDILHDRLDAWLKRVERSIGA